MCTQGGGKVMCTQGGVKSSAHKEGYIRTTEIVRNEVCQILDSCITNSPRFRSARWHTICC